MRQIKLLILSILIFPAILSMERSRRFNDLKTELDKENPDSAHVSDLYYELVSESEKEEALKAATLENIKITGQEDAQKKLKKEMSGKKIVKTNYADDTEIVSLQNQLVKKEAELEKTVEKNREMKDQLHDLLELTEEIQVKKEKIDRAKKDILENKKNIKNLESNPNIKTNRLSALAKSNNQQLREENSRLKSKLESLKIGDL